MTDNVNNPAHYGQGSIECIDYIKDVLNEMVWNQFMKKVAH